MSRVLPPLPAEDLAHVLAHTRAQWEALRGRRLFITGGTGFFGLWLLESFVHANTSLGLGADAVVLTRDPAAFARKAPHLADRADLAFVAGDVRDFAFPPGRFSHVIHAAIDAAVAPGGAYPPDLIPVILDGTRRVLEFAARAGTERLLFVSSGAVYGPQPAGLARLDETHRGAPDHLTPPGALGEGKRIAELLCADHARRHDTAAVIARCFAFIGPHLPLDRQFAAGNFLRDALAGGPVRVGGDGTPVRGYLYAADLAIWLWTLLFRGVSGHAYNVGDDDGISIAELAARIAALAPDGPVRVEVSRAPAPGAAPARYVPATDRARRELGLETLVGRDAAIARTFAWLQTAGAPGLPSMQDRHPLNAFSP